MTGGTSGSAGTDYEKAIAERDEKIATLEAQVTEAAKTAEKLCGEAAEVKAQAESDRIGFRLQLAGARNVKAARALLGDHDNDVEKLKAAEPWLFETDGKHAAKGGNAGGTGTTGLPNAGATSDDGKTLKRWREIAGLTDGDKKKEEQAMPNKIAFARNYVSAIDEVYQRAGVFGVLNSGRRMVRAGHNAKGDHDSQDLGHRAGRLHPQRRLQDGFAALS